MLVTEFSHGFNVNADRSLAHSHFSSSVNRSIKQTAPSLTKPSKYQTTLGQEITVEGPYASKVTQVVSKILWTLSYQRMGTYSATATLASSAGYQLKQEYLVNPKAFGLTDAQIAAANSPDVFDINPYALAGIAVDRGGAGSAIAGLPELGILATGIAVGCAVYASFE